MSERCCPRSILIPALLLACAASACLGPKSRSDSEGAAIVQQQEDLQNALMRHADTFCSTIGEATEQFAERVNTPEGRLQAKRWNLMQCSSMLTAAASPNPTTGLLDMIAMVSLGMTVHEEYWSTIYGEADRPMVVAFREELKSLWLLADHVLTKEQIQAFKTALKVWREEYPDLRATAFLRLTNFTALVRERSAAGNKVFGDLLSLIRLDPFAGLDPATQEIAQARLFAERAAFYGERMPILIGLEFEVLSMEFLDNPQVEEALASSQRLSVAAESFAASAVALPNQFAAEREQAVRQISEEIGSQRKALIQDLEAAQAPLQSMLGDARATIEAATRLSDSLDATTKAVSALVTRFEESDSAQGAAPAVASRPFDITEYTAAAEGAGEAARELNTLLGTVDKTLPQTRGLLDDVSERSEQTVELAYRRGLTLIGILIGGAVVGALFVRWASARWMR